MTDIPDGPEASADPEAPVSPEAPGVAEQTDPLRVEALRMFVRVCEHNAMDRDTERGGTPDDSNLCLWHTKRTMVESYSRLGDRDTIREIVLRELNMGRINEGFSLLESFLPGETISDAELESIALHLLEGEYWMYAYAALTRMSSPGSGVGEKFLERFRERVVEGGPGTANTAKPMFAFYPPIFKAITGRALTREEAFKVAEEMAERGDATSNMHDALEFSKETVNMAAPCCDRPGELVKTTSPRHHRVSALASIRSIELPGKLGRAYRKEDVYACDLAGINGKCVQGEWPEGSSQVARLAEEIGHWDVAFRIHGRLVPENPWGALCKKYLGKDDVPGDVTGQLGGYFLNRGQHHRNHLSAARLCYEAADNKQGIVNVGHAYAGADDLINADKCYTDAGHTADADFYKNLGEALAHHNAHGNAERITEAFKRYLELRSKGSSDGGDGGTPPRNSDSGDKNAGCVPGEMPRRPVATAQDAESAMSA